MRQKSITVTVHKVVDEYHLPGEMDDNHGTPTLVTKCGNYWLYPQNKPRKINFPNKNNCPKCFTFEEKMRIAAQSKE